MSIIFRSIHTIKFARVDLKDESHIHTHTLTVKGEGQGDIQMNSRKLLNNRLTSARHSIFKQFNKITHARVRGSIEWGRNLFIE